VNSQLDVASALVVDTQPQDADGLFGRGLHVQLGGSATVVSAAFEGNHDTTLNVAEDESALSVEDVVVRGTRTVDDDGGRGVSVFPSGRFAARRLRLADNVLTGLISENAGAVTLEDVEVTGTVPRPLDGTGGRGLSLQSGGTATLARVRLEGNHDVGLFVAAGDIQVTVEDLTVRDTAPLPSGLFGRGINLQESGAITGSRVVVIGNYEVGLVVNSLGSTVDLDQIVVRGTRPRVVDGRFGRGLGVQLGGRGEIRRALIEDNHDVGVFAGGLNAELVLEDLVVRDTEPAACGAVSPTACPAGGMGMVALETAAIAATSFLLEGNAVCGVQLANDGEIRLSRGEVVGHAIGACVQVDGYPLERLTDDVRYRDNGINLDSTSLPVPESAVPVPES
jgi:hypothetical protein